MKILNLFDKNIKLKSEIRSSKEECSSIVILSLAEPRNHPCLALLPSYSPATDPQRDYPASDAQIKVLTADMRPANWTQLAQHDFVIYREEIKFNLEKTRDGCVSLQ